MADTETVEKPAAPEKPKAADKAAKVQMIWTVYGRMVDPLTGLEYDRKPTELLKRTGWVDSQIDSGKMTLC